MKPFKHDFLESLAIGLSYILLWAPAVYFIENMNTSNFLASYISRTWNNTFILLANLFIFHVVIKIQTKTTHRILLITAGILLTLLIISDCYIQWLKLGMWINTYPRSEESMININYLTRAFIYQVFGITYFAVFKLLFRYIKLKNRNFKLQLAQKTTELNFLKSQTNPHFLFNTLNGIYSLARDKSDLTADSVMRLSDILRYMLYETQTDLIPIEKEIEIIEEYIELEKLRYDNSLAITFLKEIDNLTQKIPPLLLIHLVENAFKHGISETINSPFVHLHLSIQNKKLNFFIENSISSQEVSVNYKESIGLTNLKRQLGLLFTEHQLSTTKTATSFTVNLYINLSSYVQSQMHYSRR